MHTLWQIFRKLGMHIAWDEFYILSNFEVTRSKVKVTEVMAAAGAFVLRVDILFDLFLYIIVCVPPSVHPPVAQPNYTIAAPCFMQDDY